MSWFICFIICTSNYFDWYCWIILGILRNCFHYCTVVVPFSCRRVDDFILKKRKEKSDMYGFIHNLIAPHVPKIHILTWRRPSVISLKLRKTSRHGGFNKTEFTMMFDGRCTDLDVMQLLLVNGHLFIINDRASLYLDSNISSFRRYAAFY